MSEPYSLIVKRHGLILDERQLDAARLTVGRDPEADLVLEDPSVSLRMAVFELSNGELRVTDPGSLEGLTVNGESADETMLQRGDVVGLGPFVLEIEGGPDPVAAPAPAPATPGARDTQPNSTGRRAVGVVQHPDNAGEPERDALVRLELPGSGRMDLGPGEHAIGRDASCRIALVAGAVSKHHADLEITATAMTLHDRGSTNGTFVNGARVTERELRSGDVLRFGDVEVTVSGLAAPFLGSVAGATVVTMGAPDEGSSRGGAGDTVLTGAALLEQSLTVGEDAPAPEEAGRSSRLRLLLIVLMVVIAGMLALVFFSSSSDDSAGIAVETAPAPAPVAPSQPVVDAAGLFERGRAALREDRIEEAASLWQQAIQADSTIPGLVDAYGKLLYDIGYVYEGDGRLDAARQTWERLIDVLDRYPEAPYVIKARVRLRRLEAPR